MSKYLGEFPVDLAKSKYSQYTSGDWALLFIEKYGGIDGDHHKAWVLDQVARCLNGVPVVVVEARWDDGETEYRISTAEEESALYKTWVKALRGKETDGEYEYDYEVGIAP